MISPNAKWSVIDSAAIREAEVCFFAPRYWEIITALAEEITEKTMVAIDTAWFAVLTDEAARSS